MALTFSEYESFDGLGLANLIRRKIISQEEVLQAAIERIELRNPPINAVIHKMYDQARAAIQSDLPEGPLKGVPILLKDLLADYKDVPMRFGSRYAYDNKWVSPFDSESVKRFKRAGLLFLGKTNVPEFGLSAVTEPALFGPTCNPWDITKSSGGSSGGSAAAVAARMVPIAHGGDGGGSIRIPSAYTGLFGFKPSRGRTPTGPVYLRLWLGMVVDHALTRSVRDSAAMLDVLAGPELGSPISLPKPERSYLSELEKALPKLRIALIDQPFFTASLDPEYSSALKNAGKLCQDLGHHVEPAVFQFDSEEVAFAFLIIMMSETNAGVKMLAKIIGKKPQTNELEKATALLCRTAEQLTASDYAWAVNVLDTIGQKMAKFFEKFDVILTPTMPFPAPIIGSTKPSKYELKLMSLLQYIPYGFSTQQIIQRAAKKMFSFMAFTSIFNICGNPAMSVPLFTDKKGMPIGIQFAGKLGQDALLLQLAQQLETAAPWEQRKPESLKD